MMEAGSRLRDSYRGEGKSLYYNNTPYNTIHLCCFRKENTSATNHRPFGQAFTAVNIDWQETDQFNGKITTRGFKFCFEVIRITCS